MTTKTVITLTEAQLRFLRAATAAMQHAQGQSAARLAFAADRVPAERRLAFQEACEIAAFSICAPRLPLDHQEAQDLLELLELAESVELSATDTTADDSEDFEPMGSEAAFIESAAAAHCRL